MKQRTTFLLPQGDDINPKDIKVGSDHLNFTKAHRADVENRITLSLNELPDDVGLIFYASVLCFR